MMRMRPIPGTTRLRSHPERARRGGDRRMLQFFRRRIARARKSALRHSNFIEPLETRRLLSADVTVDLHITTPTSSLLPGEEPRDVIYDITRNQLLVINHNMVRR